jgi:hypothetical protein
MHCICTPRLCAVATVHDIFVAHVAARVRRKVRVLTEKAEQHRRAACCAVATARLRQCEQRVSRVAVRREDGVERAWSMRAWSVRGACVERAWSVRGACVERAWSVRGACVERAWSVRAGCRAEEEGEAPRLLGSVHGVTAGVGTSPPLQRSATVRWSSLRP